MSPAFSSLTKPYVIPHNGANYNAPDHTDEAYRYAVAAGFKVLDLDARQLANGLLANFHDATIDAQTTGTGNVSDQTALNWMTLAVDAGTWFAPAWSNSMKTTLISEILQRYDGQSAFTIEAKSSGYMQSIVNLVQSLKLQSACVLQSTTLSDLSAAVSAGIPAAYISDNPDVAATVAAGVQYVIISLAAANVASVVSNCLAAGLKVWIWNVNTQYDYAAAVALGAEGIYCNDPVYAAALNGYITNKDLFATQTWQPGHLQSLNSRGTFVSTNRWGYQTAGENSNALLGFLRPSSTSYTLTFTVTFDAAGATNSAYAYAHICEPDDRPYTDNSGSSGYTNGYRIELQKQGVLIIRRTDASGSVLTTLVSKSTSVPADGSVAVITVTVSPTTITAQATVDGVASAVASTTDTTYRGLTSPHMGQAGLAGLMKTSFSGISIA